jgi:hypothetical protein
VWQWRSIALQELNQSEWLALVGRELARRRIDQAMALD